jgi:hypothetical protein
MPFLRKILALTLLGVILIVPAMAGCSANQDPTKKQVQAINAIRTRLELPKLALTFIELTTMINSPGGNLVVAIYQDDAGRKYSVDPESNQVVEIDARTLLSNLPAGAVSLSEDNLIAKAQKYVSVTLPDFDTRQAKLSYETGNKGDNYFFSWYDDNNPSAMNRPFVQVGLHKSGVLFTYSNTLILEK